MNSSEQLWVASITVVVCLVVLVIIVTLSARQKQCLILPATSLQLSSDDTRPGNKAARLSQMQVPKIVPLKWDEREGAFIVNVKLGKNWMPMVLDGGSNHISAKAEKCSWLKCSVGSDNDECSVEACPCDTDDCSTRSYKPSYNPSSSLQKNNKTQQLEYGTQVASVKKSSEPFYLQTYSLVCQDFSQPVLSALTEKQQSVQRYGPTDVYIAHQIKGTSTSNILGLAQGDKTSVVRLLTKDSRGVWAFWSSGYEEAFVSFGSFRCFGQPSFVPLVKPRVLRNFVTSFYVVQVKGVLVNNKLITGNGVPQYIVLDTGTDNSYGSPRFGQRLLEEGYDERLSSLGFVLDNGVTLSYTAAELADPTRVTPSVVHVTEGRTMPGFDSLFNGANVFLLGIRMMLNRYWEYDTRKRRLGVI